MSRKINFLTSRKKPKIQKIDDPWTLRWCEAETKTFFYEETK